MNRNAAVVLLGLLCSAAAWADVGPPPGQKRVPVTTVVEVAEEFPDYVFVEFSSATVYGSPGPPEPGKPPGPSGWRVQSSVSIVTPKPGQPVRNTGGRRSGSTLYAIPKAATGKSSYEELVRAAAAGKLPGAAWIGFGTMSEIPAGDPRTEISVRYRVERTADGVAFTPADAAPTRPAAESPAGTPGESGGGGTAGGFPWRWVVAGGAVAVAVVLAGLWAVGRARRTGGTATNV